MTLYFIDGKLDEAIVNSISEMMYDKPCVIDASKGYTATLKEIDEVYMIDQNATVITNCVHLLNYFGVWTEGVKKKSIHPNVYILMDNEFVNISKLAKIRFDNNIETMYRTNRLSKGIEIKL